jgi:DHA1 family tetracycline resistance protein-like MFS transporter
MRYHIRIMQKKFSLLTIFLIVFIDMLGVGIIIPVIAPLFFSPTGILPLGTSYETRAMLMGFLTASYPFAQFFGAPILGAMSDRFGRKPVLMASLSGTLVGYILFGFAVLTANIPLLFLSRMLDGFTGGNISVAMSTIADMTDKEHRAKNFGIVGMAFGLGFILGPYIGGKFADPNIVSWFNAATPFFFAAGLTGVNILMVIIRFSETLKKKIMTRISFTTGFRNIIKGFSMPNLRVMFTIVLLMTFGFTFFTQFFQVYLIEKFGYTSSQIGDVFAYIGLWIAFTQGFINRFISTRIPSHRVLRFTIIGLALTFPALLFPETTPVLLCVLPFVAIFQGLTQPNQNALISASAGAESQGEVMGINSSLQAFGQMIPPILAGFLITVDIRLPILVAGAFTFIAWLLYIIYFNEKRSRVFHEVK